MAITSMCIDSVFERKRLALKLPVTVNKEIKEMLGGLSKLSLCGALTFWMVKCPQIGHSRPLKFSSVLNYVK